MKRPLALIAIAATSLVCGTAAAIPVEYNGGLFDFNVTGTGPGSNQYQITYTADFTNYSAGSQTHIGGIQWTVSGNPVTAASLTSAPGTGTWNVGVSSSLSANGCSGNAAGAVCAQSTSPFALATGVMSWTFLATFTSALPSNFNEINSGNPIRMWFVDASGRNRGLMSCVTANSNGECGTAVPEPGTLALLGLGLLGMGFVRRRA